MKYAPLKDLCALGGWKSPQTVLTCYQQADAASMQQALAARHRLEARALTDNATDNIGVRITKMITPRWPKQSRGAEIPVWAWVEKYRPHTYQASG